MNRLIELRFSTKDFVVIFYLFIMLPVVIIAFSADIVSSSELLSFNYGQGKNAVHYNIILIILIIGALAPFILYLYYPRIKSRPRKYADEKPLEFIKTHAILPYISWGALIVFIILIGYNIFVSHTLIGADTFFTFQVIGENYTQTIARTGLFFVFWIMYFYLAQYIGTRFFYPYFSYYTAKAYIQLSSQPQPEPFRHGDGKLEKLLQLSYLTRGLKSYNKFLQANLNLQIKDIEKLCSTITCDTPENQANAIRRLLGGFSLDDSLRALREIGIIMQMDAAEMLSDKKRSEKIKDWGAIIAAVIPLIIGILQVIHILPKFPGT